MLRAQRNLNRLDKPLSSRSFGLGATRYFVSSRRAGSSFDVALTGLLIFDPETVHFTPRPFANEPCAPVLELVGNISHSDFGVDSALSVAGFLLQVICNIDLVGTAIMLGFGRTSWQAQSIIGRAGSSVLLT